MPEVIDVDISQVELGIVVNLATLRQALKQLSVSGNGKRWWLVSDPIDAAATGYSTIGHGDQGCVDRLNTLYFNLPVISDGAAGARSDSIVLLLKPSVCVAVDPGIYLEDGLVVEDTVEDFRCFFQPLIRALAAKLQEENR